MCNHLLLSSSEVVRYKMINTFICISHMYISVSEKFPRDYNSGILVTSTHELRFKIIRHFSGNQILREAMLVHDSLERS